MMRGIGVAFTTTGRRRRDLLREDGAPLRKEFLEGNDVLVYTVVRNFFAAARETIWPKSSVRTPILATVGIQAQFDFLSAVVTDAMRERDLSAEYFAGRLAPAASVDFTNPLFSPSGAGRVAIRSALFLKTGIPTGQASAALTAVRKVLGM